MNFLLSDLIDKLRSIDMVIGRFGTRFNDDPILTTLRLQLNPVNVDVNHAIVGNRCSI